MRSHRERERERRLSGKKHLSFRPQNRQQEGRKEVQFALLCPMGDRVIHRYSTLAVGLSHRRNLEIGEWRMEIGEWGMENRETNLKLKKRKGPTAFAKVVPFIETLSFNLVSLPQS